MDVSVIGDIRLTKLVYCRLLMAELPVTSRLFGFELEATRCQGAILTRKTISTVCTISTV